MISPHLGPWRIRGQKMVVHFRAQDIALDFLHDRPEAFAAQSAATAVFQPMTEKAGCGPEVFGILAPVLGVPC